MAYYFGSGIWGSVFAVPNTVVDKHIKLCSPLSLKVLMILLRNGGNLELDDLASMLGQSRADVQDALNYWIANKVIQGGADDNPPERRSGTRDRRSGDRRAPLVLAAPSALTYTVRKDDGAAPAPEEPEPQEAGQQPPQKERRVVTVSQSRPRLTPQEINEMADRDKSIGNLLQETQQIMGKPLTPVATDLVVGLYSYYGMQPDLVLMLIQYCVTLGKDSVRYMEKVAASWMEQGIDTHEKAEAEILRATQANQAEGRIKSAFGIYDRTLVPAEKKYIAAWTEEYNMDLKLIQLAFERCVEVKGKMSFAYINGILSNWYKKDVRTTEQAMREIAAGKPASGGDGRKAASSYDRDELKDLMASGDVGQG